MIVPIITTLNSLEQTERYGKIAVDCPRCHQMFYGVRYWLQQCPCGHVINLTKEEPES